MSFSSFVCDIFYLFHKIASDFDFFLPQVKNSGIILIGITNARFANSIVVAWVVFSFFFCIYKTVLLLN